MFSGNIVLLVLIIVGVFQCQHLPKKIDQSVTVFEYQKELGQSVTSIARLAPYGVRGAVIGWTDGFLQSWGETYTQKSTELRVAKQFDFRAGSGPLRYN